MTQEDLQIIHRLRNALEIISGHTECMLMEEEFDFGGCLAIKSGVKRILQVVEELERDGRSNQG